MGKRDKETQAESDVNLGLNFGKLNNVFSLSLFLSRFLHQKHKCKGRENKSLFSLSLCKVEKLRVREKGGEIIFSSASSEKKNVLEGGGERGRPVVFLCAPSPCIKKKKKCKQGHVCTVKFALLRKLHC